MPLITALRRKKQVDLCEFETILARIVISRTARTLSQKQKDKVGAGGMALELRGHDNLS